MSSGWVLYAVVVLSAVAAGLAYRLTSMGWLSGSALEAPVQAGSLLLAVLLIVFASVLAGMGCSHLGYSSLVGLVGTAFLVAFLNMLSSVLVQRSRLGAREWSKATQTTGAALPDAGVPRDQGVSQKEANQ